MSDRPNGRPRVIGDAAGPSVVVSVRLPVHLVRVVEDFARKVGLSRSDVMRELLHDALELLPKVD